MISIYPANAEDFTTLGLGTLEPVTCEIEERAAGLYELVLRQPIMDDQRAFLLAVDRIIKAGAPVRETPEVTIGNTGTNTVTRDIWQVKTNGSRLHLRAKPNGKIIGAYYPGTKVVKAGESSVDGWWGVIVCDGGAKGYMYSQYLEHVGEETETIVDDTPGTVIRPRQTREQLFRIYSVTSDSAGRYVEARARHISYDLAGAVVTGQYAPENVSAATVCAELLARTDHDAGISIICAVTQPISGDFGGKNLLECLLEPETGVAALTGAKVVRDNFDIFLLPDEPRRRNAEIRYGKNLLTASLVQDASDVVTRIFPVGRDEKGEDLNAEPVDSPYISDYPVIRSARVEYDVAVGDDMTREQALARLKELAEADFAAGCDLVTAKLDAEFLRLELAPQYAALANQYALHLYDSVPVIDRGAGINATVRMVGYTFDALLERYTGATLGDIAEISSPIYGYELAGGTIGGTKIARNSITGANLRDLTIHTAKIANAAVTNAKIALLAVDTAKIKDLAVTAAKIADATITSAKIQNAAIGSAQIGDASITEAKIADASIGTAKIKAAAIDTAKIALGAITAALIAQGAVGTAQIADGSITDAKIVELTANKINAGTLSVERLIVVGSDKSIVYTINEANGTAQLSQTTIDGGALTQRSITADRIAAGAITAKEIAAATILANNINVQDLFAAEATILALDNYILRTATIEALQGRLDIWADDKISLAVNNIQVGGTNLLLDSAAGKTASSYEVATFYLSDVPSDGETVTVQLWGSLGSDRDGIMVYNSGGIQYLGNLYWDGSAYSGTFAWRTYGDNNRITIWQTPSSGTSTSTIKKIKLERGNKATDWTPSPEDPTSAYEVVDGSQLTITKDEVHIDTPVFSVNVNGTGGDMSISESGLAIDQVNSPSVMARYTGPTYLTVGGTADGVSTFASLSDAFAVLSNRFIPKPVEIGFAASTVENRAELTNTVGAKITVNGQGHTLNGRIYITNMANKAVFTRLNLVTNGGGDVFSVGVCANVEWQNGAISGGASNNYGANIRASRLTMLTAQIDNCYMAVKADAGSSVYIQSCTGSGNTYAAGSYQASLLGMYGTRPSATYGLYCERGSWMSDDPGAASGSGTTVTPTVTTTVTLTAINSRTHDGGGWYSGTNVVAQGKTSDGGVYKGCMWFDRSAISGKTIRSARIRLYRRAGVGKGSPVVVLIGTMSNASPSGGVATVTEYGDIIGTVDQKAWLEATIPTAAAQQLADGSATGLYAYGSLTNYAQFDGYGDSNPPQLIVTYT